MTSMQYAICNETFEGWDPARVCRFVAGLGYTGLELAPFTLAPRITDVTPERRRELRRQAVDNAVDTFQRALPGIVESGVKLCLEPLAPTEADFINTAAEGLEILDRIGHPSFVLHLDVKAMSSESTPVPDLIRLHAARTG